MNRITKLSSYKDLNLENFKNDNSYIVQLDGKNMPRQKDFFECMKIGFKLPEDASEGWDQFDDWMTDLSWLDDDRDICLIIYNYNFFIPWNISEFEDDFKKDILPFWEKDAPNILSGAKIRKFNIYLVEDIDPNEKTIEYEPDTVWRRIKKYFK